MLKRLLHNSNSSSSNQHQTLSLLLLTLTLTSLAPQTTATLAPVTPVKSYGAFGGYACCKHLAPAHSIDGAALLENTGNEPALLNSMILIGSECRILPQDGCGKDWFVGCVPYLVRDGSICVAREMDGDGRRVAEFLYDLGDIVEEEFQESHGG